MMTTMAMAMMMMMMIIIIFVDDDDDSWWWFMVMIHDDDSWLWFMMMIHDDSWWFMMMMMMTDRQTSWWCGWWWSWYFATDVREDDLLKGHGQTMAQSYVGYISSRVDWWVMDHLDISHMTIIHLMDYESWYFPSFPRYQAWLFTTSKHGS